MSRVRVYLACSLDGYIAGPDNDLSWLDPGEQDYSNTKALTFEAFMADVGCMLMGRTTFDVVAGMGVWPYGDTPVLVATHRALPDAPTTVQAVSGNIHALIGKARSIAGDKDVYLDGGQLARHGIEAGLVDELTLTHMPILLGGGVRLFDTLGKRIPVTLDNAVPYGQSMFQITATLPTTNE